MKMIVKGDVLTMITGTVAWTVAIPAVNLAGRTVAKGGLAEQVGAIVLGVGIAYGTTPLLSAIMGWTTPYQKVRGVALSLGTAQVIDGLVHIFFPAFYSSDHGESIASAANIFFGAGMLGIFSAFA